MADGNNDANRNYSNRRCSDSHSNLIWGIGRCYSIFDGLFYEGRDKDNGDDKTKSMMIRKI